MTSEPLHRPYIGITLYVDDYAKVQRLLPTPSYATSLQTYNNQKIVLVYAMEGHISSANQYRWISNIKLGLEKYLCVPFTYEEDYHITDETDMTVTLYTIDELSKAFKAPLITYPKIMYPQTKKDLYRHLCWYGKRLIHQKVFTKEVLTATALLMNAKLQDKYSSKDLHKKVLGTYIWICDNMDGFKVKLDDSELQEAHSRGATTKNLNQAQKTKERIDQLLQSGNFIKRNGKVNLSSLAKAMNMTPKTVAKYV